MKSEVLGAVQLYHHYAPTYNLHNGIRDELPTPTIDGTLAPGLHLGMLIQMKAEAVLGIVTVGAKRVVRVLADEASSTPIPRITIILDGTTLTEFRPTAYEAPGLAKSVVHTDADPITLHAVGTPALVRTDAGSTTRQTLDLAALVRADAGSVAVDTEMPLASVGAKTGSTTIHT